MDNEKLISPYISSQFPRNYRENYSQFVEFVRMYYAWLEQKDQALGHAKRLEEYRDIDETPEDYITHFKNKFLPYLKFVTNVDKRALVKHVQDLYRSKGTERGVDLFFKLVYGVPAEVYYPATDLFRLSDNTWVKRNYLEVAHLEIINNFIGRKIIGTRSGATAFAERFVQKKVGGADINLLYISNIEGDFIFNEKLTYEGLAIGDKKRPRIIGSLSRLDITSGSKNFKVGDLVEVESAHGHGARARVANTYDSSGTVDFMLVDGGWGYTTLSEVYVSDKLLAVSNIVPDYTTNNPDVPEYDASPFYLLEGITQPFNRFDYSFDSGYQNIVVNKPTSSWYQTGAILYQRDSSSGSNVAVGTIISNSAINTTAQSLVINIDKTQSGVSDFYITSGSYGNARLSTSSAVNSIILSVNSSVNTATISVSTELNSYNSIGGVIATVEVVDTAIDTAKTGNLFVYVISGVVTTNSHFWVAGNSYSINVSTYNDKTATANVVGFGNTLTLHVTNSSSLFVPGQYLTQRRTYPGGYSISANGKISGIFYVGSSADITLKETSGIFRPDVNVYMQTAPGVDSGSTAYLNSYDGTLGIANVYNDFFVAGNNKIFSVSSNSSANLITMSTGKHATFDIADTFSYAEEYSIYTDRVGGNNTLSVPYMSLGLNDAEWSFPKTALLGGFSNVTAILGDVLADVTGYIGGVTKLVSINPGEDYNLAPFVLIKDPYISGFHRKDFIITSTDVDGSFTVGEQVTQVSGATGQIRSIEIATSGLHTIRVKRQRLNIDFTVGDTMTGLTTLTTALVTGVTEDDSVNPIGLNAVVTANVAVADGIVGSLEILASGYGFRNDEEATFTSQDGLKTGTAKAKLIKQGVTDGVFMDESSFVSSSKYLFDGDYWQEYSYDIKTAIPRDAYKENYLTTMHLAGTKMFSTFVLSSENDVKMDVGLPELTANVIADV